MKRCISLLLMLALLAAVPALAEPAPAEAPSTAIAQDTPAFVDLDGDGVAEVVSWTMAPDDFEAHLRLVVTPSGSGELTCDTEIVSAGAVYATDLDGDGAVELFMTGDVMSDDYYTWCLRFKDGALRELLFADASRGDNADGYFKMGYGLIETLDDGTVTLVGSQDVLGTWMASRRFRLAGDRFELDDDGFWLRQFDPGDDDLWEYAALTLKTSLPYAGVDGGPDGTLNPGDRILVVASDKRETARFITAEGLSGALSIAPDDQQGWGWRIGDVSEAEAFEFVPYAD